METAEDEDKRCRDGGSGSNVGDTVFQHDRN
jgi:hypothetical protein